MVNVARQAAAIVSQFPAPVLILSTHAGRGMFSIGEALRTACGAASIQHRPVEALLPAEAVDADLRRYRRIVDYAPYLLHLMYRVPYFYRRKLSRERSAASTPLVAFDALVRALEPGSIVAISHRAAFWAGACKARTGARVQLWGLEAEYGPSLGWQYVFWDQMDGFLSPQRAEDLPYPCPAGLAVHQVAIPVASAFTALAHGPGDPNRVLLTGGYWGLGRLAPLAQRLVAAHANLRLDVVCGDNAGLRATMERTLASYRDRVQVFGAVDTLVPLMARASAVIGKPGISTIAETAASGRRLFLLKGLPVAEDHNADYAVRQLGATWFSEEAFGQWWRSEPR